MKTKINELLSQFSVNNKNITIFNGDQEVIQKLHGIDDMLPDNYRFDSIVRILERLTEYDFESFEELRHTGIDHEIIESLTDVYNQDLLKWLSSNLVRTDYVNEAYNCGYLDSRHFDIFDAIRVGQYLELQYLMNNILKYLGE
jgi:hypothetical protein